MWVRTMDRNKTQQGLSTCIKNKNILQIIKISGNHRQPVEAIIWNSEPYRLLIQINAFSNITDLEIKDNTQ
jgi:hypothetical protein